MALQKINFKTVKLADIKPAAYNPRQDGIIEDELSASIDEFGMLEPIVVNSREHPDFPEHEPTIVGGHQRYFALLKKGETETDVVWVNFNPTAEKKANLALNKITGEWDDQKLFAILKELEAQDEDMTATGYTDNEINQIINDPKMIYPDTVAGSLAEKFVIPPFSVFDARGGLWKDRRSEWDEIIGDLAETREGVLGSVGGLMGIINEGSSIFDPVLAEVMYRWFCPKGGKILDNFAGEQTKAFVASKLGYHYTGIEIRPEQVEHNKAALEKRGINEGVVWITGDSTKVDYQSLDKPYDFIFTSPPYYDLEVYSKDDMSALGTYDEFMKQYRITFEGAISVLAPNRFLAVKVGEIRDKKTGVFRSFVADNIKLFTDLGLQFYNDIVLLNSIGTASLRANQGFKNRKTAKVHQNVLLFYKGDLSARPETENPGEFFADQKLLKTHDNILVFYKGDLAKIQEEFGNVYAEDLLITE